MGIIADLKRRLFRWQSDGTAPLRLAQRRIFILPTRAGLLFAAALLAMLTGAINYNLALGHALVFLLAGLALVGMVHAFRNLHGLVITPGRCDPVFAGEVAHFPLYLTSERGAPRLALELRAGDESRSVATAVAARGLSEVAVPVASLRRGWLDLPRTRLATTYPLGLFVAWSYLQPAMRCLVYPQPLATPLPPQQPATRTGDHHGDGGQEDFAGFRERQPADSPRHVAWKASARRRASVAGQAVRRRRADRTAARLVADTADGPARSAHCHPRRLGNGGGSRGRLLRSTATGAGNLTGQRQSAP